MRPRSPGAADALSAFLAFWCGVASAGLAFCLFHRLDVAFNGRVGAAGIALAVLCLAGTAGEMLARGFWTPGRKLALAGGVAAGFAALSAGLPEFVDDLRMALACGVVLALGVAAARLAGGPRQVAPSSGGGRLPERGARGLQLVALGIVVVSLLRTYSYSTGWWAYAASDLGIAFCLGLIICRVFFRLYSGSAELAVIARGLILLSLTVVLGWSFFLYPDLILSEPAVLQSSGTLLTPGRLFPLWFMAAVLGGLLPSRPEGASGRAGWEDGAALAVGAVAAGLMPADVSVRWQYVAAAVLCAISLAPVCVVSPRRGVSVALPLRVAAMAVAVAGLVWVFIVSPDLGWGPLKGVFAGYMSHRRGRLNYVPLRSELQGVRAADVEVDSVHFVRYGLEAGAQALGVNAVLLRGNVVMSSRAQDEQARCAAYALRQVCVAGQSESPRYQRDTVVWPLGMPLTELNVEGLRLLEEESVVVWLPTRTVSPKELRRLLATVCAVYDRTRLFAFRDELVLVAGGTEKLDYARLARLFQDPAWRSQLMKAGLWDPRQLVAALVADTDQVRALAAGARPYRLWRPARPPVLVRDLAADSRADVLAMATQYRLALAGRLGDLVEFRSEVEKLRTLPGLERLYRMVTEQTLRSVGSVARRGPGPLLRALADGSIDLGLFAPEAQSERMRMVVALHGFRLHRESLAALSRTMWSGEERFAEHYWRGRNLEGLKREKDAINAYGAALQERPGSVEVLMRVAGLQFRGGEFDQCQATLLAVLQVDAQNVEARILLADTYGKQRRYEEAAAVARETLELAPRDPHAQDQIMMYSGARPKKTPTGG